MNINDCIYNDSHECYRDNPQPNYCTHRGNDAKNCEWYTNNLGDKIINCKHYVNRGNNPLNCNRVDGGMIACGFTNVNCKECRHYESTDPVIVDKFEQFSNGNLIQELIKRGALPFDLDLLPDYEFVEKYPKIFALLMKISIEPDDIKRWTKVMWSDMPSGFNETVEKLLP